VSTTREQLDRLLTLYRKGAISEESLLDQLEQVADESDAAADPPPNKESSNGSAARDLALLLDEFRAAEASGAETLSRWAEQSDDPELVGGLRVLAAREYGHAVLLEHRLRELGQEPRAEIPAWLAGFNKALVADGSTDVERLGALVSQFSDDDRAAERIDQAIQIAGDDGLTREVLVAIKAEELASIDWLRDAYRRRTGSEEKDN
jgi:hypothetical protein